jgi:preprotein translocase subunit SecY
MNRFFNSLRNAFQIEELRERILFTALMLLIVRVGSFISVPGVDMSRIGQGAMGSDTLFGMFNMFVGGAYQNAAIFALGIMPYISASIIVQLFGAVVPFLQKLDQEGEEGRKQKNNITRYLTVLLAFAQGIAIAISLQQLDTGNGIPAVLPSVQGPAFTLMAAAIFTSGTVFLMWIGEQITEKGIGNGVSLIIFIGIMARLPQAIGEEFSLVMNGSRNPVFELIIIGILIGVIAGVVMFTQAVRKIPVSYAKRRMGNKVYGGSTQHLPIQLTTANVMPIIFAQAIMFIPNTIVQYLPDTDMARFIGQNFQYTSFLYSAVFALLIIFFTFFYTAIVFNPRDVAENMRKNGGYIPGVRPGKPTEEYIDNILTKVTVPGSLFLALIAIMPAFASRLQVSPTFATFFGGTSLLIMVGVALDTLKQIESYLLMRHYDGFMKSGKLRGRQAAGVPS